MLYVLVNNNYQLHALRRHGFAGLGGPEGVTLIMVPHALSATLDTTQFVAVHRFDTPLGRYRFPFILLRYWMLGRQVAKVLKPRPGDTLLFFTEVEWLNQIMVRYFRQRGARIVMMEDGGFATYIPMSAAASEPLNFLERAAQAMYRLVPGLGRSRLFKANGVLFPRLPDAAIDVIALYRDIPLNRQIQSLYVQKPPRKACAIRPSTVVFLNELMYDYYQSEVDYLAGLRRLLTALTRGFKTVHFKFHPRESENWRRKVRDMLVEEFPSVDIISREGPIEEMIADYRPEVLASYFSAPLLNLEYEGIEPLYLYHLLDDVRNQPAFLTVSRILHMLGYCFVHSDDEVRSGYCSGIMTTPDAGIELGQLLVPGLPDQPMPA